MEKQSVAPRQTGYCVPVLHTANWPAKLAGLIAVRSTRAQHRGVTLGEQAFPGLGIFHEDGAYRAVLRGLQDLLLRVTGGIDRFGLTVVVELEDLGGDALAHGIANTHVVVDPHAKFSRHDDSPLIPDHWQGF